jgi:hypothetical protein
MNCTSAPCCDMAGNASDGALAGAAATSLYHVYLGLSNQVPENLLAHILGEPAAAAFGGAVVCAVGSVLYNWLKSVRNFA